MRLIDADRFEDELDNTEYDISPAYEPDGYTFKRICEVLERTPTVDAVPVVRCRDCTHYNGHRHCDYFYQAVLDDDFCSYGAKREKPINSAPMNQEGRWMKTV